MISKLLYLQIAAVLGAPPLPVPVPAAVAPSVAAAPALPGRTVTRSAASPAVESLRADLARLISGSGLRNDRWSVMVMSLDHGDSLFEHEADTPLAPASNMKLFTTAAALYYLGPDFRYSTYLIANGPVREGVLEGDLILYGTGDPTLSNRFGSRLSPFRAFADTLEALGIREIRGDVVGDESYFSGPGAGDGWQDSYMNAAYAAPASALSFSENVVTLEVRPGAQAGWRPLVRAVPGGEGIAIVNQATTVARGGTSIHAARTAYDGPIVVRGQIAAGSGPLTRTVPLADAGSWAAAVLRETLVERGVAIAGAVRGVSRADESVVTGRTVFAPTYDETRPIRVLAIHNSPPILEVLDVVNRRSHNLLAEQTLRTVGRVAFGEGSVAAGERAVHYLLECETPGVDASALRVADGSGLSVLNRASARTFVRLLEYMARSPEWEAYWSTLPEAGAANGLRRMQRTAAEQNLRAKTGTINNVSALSGYVRAANGERLAFSIIANNVSSTWAAKRIEDQIGARIAAFDRPRPDALAAAPEAAAAEGGTGAGEAAGVVAAADTAAQQRQAATEPPAAAAAPAEATRTHTVRSGDTLDRIARQNNTTVAELQRLNPGLNPRRLQLGQRIRLP